MQAALKKYLHLERFDKAVMASLIESAKVMGEDRLEVSGCLCRFYTVSIMTK